MLGRSCDGVRILEVSPCNSKRFTGNRAGYKEVFRVFRIGITREGISELLVTARVMKTMGSFLLVFKQRYRQPAENNPDRDAVRVAIDFHFKDYSSTLVLIPISLSSQPASAHFSVTNMT